MSGYEHKERGGEWYTNKELFEQLNEMQQDFTSLRHEMKETRTMIQQYNGLRDKIDIVEKKVDYIEHHTEGKSAVGKAIREWGGWIFALVSALVYFL